MIDCSFSRQVLRSNMNERINIGGTPSDESCAQVGDENYEVLALRECKEFINQLNRVYFATFGIMPPCRLRIAAHEHDFGTYHEVEAVARNDEELEAAYWIESNTPATWDDRARLELDIAGRGLFETAYNMHVKE